MSLRNLEGATSAIEAYSREVFSANDPERSALDLSGSGFVRFLENSCIRCNKPLGSNDVKIIPPRYVQEHDAYVRQGLVPRRYMCIPCYNSMMSPLKAKAKTMPLEARRYELQRAIMLKSIIKRMLARRSKQ
ncbi:MAG: hypothetical protein KGH72_04980 [Candidatus Micrarchaeota archaeon]|nr:hypothetical protein [Candidatus Micrarchaeota archaeon]